MSRVFVRTVATVVASRAFPRVESHRARRVCLAPWGSRHALNASSVRQQQKVHASALASKKSDDDDDDDDGSTTSGERLHAPSLHRFYVDEPFGAGARVALSREESRHATRALRLKPGDALEVCDGVGGLGLGRLMETTAKGNEAVVEVEAMIEDAFGSGMDWEVVAAFGGLKGGRGDWLVEKAAELGARTLTPLLTERSAAIGKGEGSGRESRWGRVAHAASKQSLRACGLIVNAPTNVAELCAEIERDGASRLTLLAAAGAPPIGDVVRAAGADVARSGRVKSPSGPMSILPDRAAGADVARSGRILIGPEGDFTDEEIERMVRAGARPVGLGALRLRVETAAISALAAVSALVEESK